MRVLVLLSSTPNPVAVGAIVTALAADGTSVNASTRPAYLIQGQMLFIVAGAPSLIGTCPSWTRDDWTEGSEDYD